MNKYYDKKYGARTLRRAIQKDIADIISIQILNNKIKTGDNVIVDVKVENDKEFLDFYVNQDQTFLEEKDLDKKKQKKQKVFNK